MTRIIGLMVLAIMVAASAGCRNTYSRRPLCCRDEPAARPLFVPPPAPAPVNGGATFVPPTNGFPTAPPLRGQQPPSFAPTMPPAGQSRLEPRWQPAEARTPAPSAKPHIQLYAPESIEGQAADPQGPTPKKPGAQAAFPSIPQFAVVKDNVYTGLRPKLDGIDWLQQNGVKAIVQVRLFGEDDSAVRKVIENRGMRYTAFEISPVTLSKEKADEFIQLVRAGSKEGIFLYDEDGALAGALWYLHFRWGEFLDDDASQLRSRPLGLDPNRAGQHRDMWLAVQQLLSDN